MSYAPCTNPNCASYGKPHPNCKCHPTLAMAEGGDVEIDQNAVVPDEGHIDQAAVIPDDPEEQHQTPLLGATAEDYGFKDRDIGAAVQGLAAGVLSRPVVTAVQQGLSKLGAPGMSNEEIAQRYEKPEAIGFEALGMALPVSRIAKLPAVLESAGVGSKILQQAITGGVFGSLNHLNKGMLGLGDADHPVASYVADIGPSFLLGGLGGGISSLGASAIEKNLLPKFSSYLSGMGASAAGIDGIEKEMGLLNKGLLDEKAFKSGLEDYAGHLDKAAGLVAKPAAIAAATKIGAATDPALGFQVYPRLTKMISEYVKTPITKAGSAIVPAITKWLSEGMPTALQPVIDYAKKVDRGNNLIDNSVKSLFNEAGSVVSKAYDSNKDRLQIDDYLQNGGVSNDIRDETINQNHVVPDHFAEGGDVSAPENPSKGLGFDHPVSTLYPTQNIMLQAARGRMSNYLNSLRPQKHAPKLAFDSEPDQTQQKKTYHKAIDMALRPLSILDKVKDGSLDREDLGHFKALHPELEGVLQKKITEQIITSQLDGKKPNYKTKQGLSLLLGTPLSSEMTPLNIQAAQATFQMQKAAPQQQPPKGNKSTSSLTKADDSYLTGNQARVARSQRDR